MSAWGKGGMREGKKEQEWEKAYSSTKTLNKIKFKKDISYGMHLIHHIRMHFQNEVGSWKLL